MTEAEQTEINGLIADALFGWDHKENGMWSDPTGDEFKKPPNYTDNSGLVIGLKYKLRRRGFHIMSYWMVDEQIVVQLNKDNVDYQGKADTESEAICLAIKAVIDSNRNTL